MRTEKGKHVTRGSGDDRSYLHRRRHERRTIRRYYYIYWMCSDFIFAKRVNESVSKGECDTPTADTQTIAVRQTNNEHKSKLYIPAQSTLAHILFFCSCSFLINRMAGMHIHTITVICGLPALVLALSTSPVEMN